MSFEEIKSEIAVATEQARDAMGACAGVITALENAHGAMARVAQGSRSEQAVASMVSYVNAVGKIDEATQLIIRGMELARQYEAAL